MQFEKKRSLTQKCATPEGPKKSDIGPASRVDICKGAMDFSEGFETVGQMLRDFLVPW